MAENNTEHQMYMEIVQEILPELEHKLQEEYNARLAMTRKQYERKFQILEQQYKVDNQKNSCSSDSNDMEMVLSRRIHMLQNERRNWIQMEQRYQEIIEELTDRVNEYEKRQIANDVRKNKENKEGKIMIIDQNLLPSVKKGASFAKNVEKPKRRQETEFSDISSIYPPPISDQQENPQYSEPDDIETLNNQEIRKIKKADTMKNSIINQAEQKRRRHASQQNNMRLNNLCADVDQSQQLSSKYFSNNPDQDMSEEEKEAEMSEEEEEYRNFARRDGRNLYESVLSPPKTLQKIEDRNEGSKNAGVLLWNEEKKKQLLSLIKLK